MGRLLILMVTAVSLWILIEPYNIGAERVDQTMSGAWAPYSDDKALLPSAVRVISGEGVYDAYNLKAQIIRYDRIIQNTCAQPYVIILSCSGEAFPERELLSQYMCAFADEAEANMLAFGYKSAQVCGVLSADLNEDYSVCSVTAALQVSDAYGAVTYIPYACCGANAVTCSLGAGEETYDTFGGKYIAALSAAAPYDPFAEGGLTQDERQIVSDLLYNYRILDGSPYDAARIFSGYDGEISRDDFVFLLICSLSRRFPGVFSAAGGAIYDKPAEPAFTDTNMPYVNMAYALGIVPGGDLFGPETGLSRDEAAVMLAKTFLKLRDLGLITMDPGDPPDFAGIDPDSQDILQPGCNVTKLYALKGLQLLNAMMEPYAAAPVLAQSADRSVISGEFVAPGAFADALYAKSRFDEPVDFVTPGSRTVHIRLEDGDGKSRVIQARLTVYAGTRNITREALAQGGGLDISAFLDKSQDLSRVRMFTNTGYITLSKPGRYYAQIMLGDDISWATVDVVDATPPSAVPRPVSVFAGDEVSPEDFVSDVYDCSGYSVSFADGAPDVDTVGERSVNIILTDDFGNTAYVSSTLTVDAEDVTPPVFAYIPNRYYQIGEDVDLLEQVRATDDYDANVKITCDASAVDQAEPGRYAVVYAAEDRSGNVTFATAYVVMTNASVEKVFSYADRVLAQIITDGMSDRQKAKAIYDWVVTNIGYVDAGDKSDPITGAYTALTKQSGDCYNYYAVSEVLLTRAGIENIAVARLTTSPKHFWQFVNCGDGWYYFDTTPFAVHLDGFMFTDAEAMKRRGKSGRNYSFDRSLYEDIDLK